MRIEPEPTLVTPTSRPPSAPGADPQEVDRQPQRVGRRSHQERAADHQLEHPVQLPGWCQPAEQVGPRATPWGLNRPRATTPSSCEVTPHDGGPPTGLVDGCGGEVGCHHCRGVTHSEEDQAGVMRAPPPIPVRPTTTPTRNPATRMARKASANRSPVSTCGLSCLGRRGRSRSHRRSSRRSPGSGRTWTCHRSPTPSCCRCSRPRRSCDRPAPRRHTCRRKSRS